MVCGVWRAVVGQGGTHCEFAVWCVVCGGQSSGKEERIVKQMQYMAWPDHGVPDDSSDFRDFVVRVRQCRTGVVEPTVVHCRLLSIIIIISSIVFIFMFLHFKYSGKCSGSIVCLC